MSQEQAISLSHRYAERVTQPRVLSEAFTPAEGEKCIRSAYRHHASRAAVHS